MITLNKACHWLDSLLIKLEANLSLFFMRQAYWVVDLRNMAHGPILNLKDARKAAHQIGFGRLITSELCREEWIILLSGQRSPKKLIKRRYNMKTGRLYR